MTLAQFKTLWEEDCRQLVPDFRLLDADVMHAALDRMRKFYGRPKASDTMVACWVLRDGAEDKIEGVPAAWWWITLSLNLLPDYVSTPWFEVMWWIYEKARGQRQLNTFWGAASTGKTTFFVALTVTNMVVWEGGGAYVYVTGPWMTATDDKIWGGDDGIHSHFEAWNTEPPPWLAELKLTIRVTSVVCELINEKGRSTSAKFVALRSSAALAGKKRKATLREDIMKINPKKGVVLVLSDEIIHNPDSCAMLLRGAANLVANANVQMIVAFNPVPHQVQHPDALELSEPRKEGSPLGIESLSPDKTFSWETARGHVYRFAWSNSPNRHGRTIFPFLINQEQTAVQMRLGQEDIAGQTVAWGFGESNNGSAMTHEDTIKPHLQEQPAWMEEPVRAMTIDPALGGSDPAIATCLAFGRAMVGGRPRHVLSICEKQERIRVERHYKFQAHDWEDYQRLARKRGGAPSDNLSHKVGGEIEGKHHMTLGILRKAEEWNVPNGNVTFDATQRADVHVPISSALGRVIWYYEGSRRIVDEENDGVWMHYPPEIEDDGTMRKWSAVHGKVISMIWRFAERMINREYVYGLRLAHEGTKEMLGRPWVRNAGGKLDVLGKDKMTRSPAHAETLSIVIYFAVRFLGALPGLFATQAQGGGADMNADLLRLHTRRLDRCLYA